MDFACGFIKPPPLDEKKKESNEVNQILEVKTADSKAIDLESKGQAESAKVGDSEKQNSDSKNLESAIDSEFKNKQVEILRLFSKSKHDKNLDSKKLAESIRALDSEKLD